MTVSLPCGPHYFWRWYEWSWCKQIFPPESFAETNDSFSFRLGFLQLSIHRLPDDVRYWGSLLASANRYIIWFKSSRFARIICLKRFWFCFCLVSSSIEDLLWLSELFEQYVSNATTSLFRFGRWAVMTSSVCYSLSTTSEKTANSLR